MCCQDEIRSMNGAVQLLIAEPGDNLPLPPNASTLSRAYSSNETLESSLHVSNYGVADIPVRRPKFDQSDVAPYRLTSHRCRAGWEHAGVVCGQHGQHRRKRHHLPQDPAHQGRRGPGPRHDGRGGGSPLRPARPRRLPGTHQHTISTPSAHASAHHQHTISTPRITSNLHSTASYQLTMVDGFSMLVHCVHD